MSSRAAAIRDVYLRDSTLIIPTSYYKIVFISRVQGALRTREI